MITELLRQKLLYRATAAFQSFRLKKALPSLFPPDPHGHTTKLHAFQLAKPLQEENTIESFWLQSTTILAQKIFRDTEVSFKLTPHRGNSCQGRIAECQTRTSDPPRFGRCSIPHSDCGNFPSQRAHLKKTFSERPKRSYSSDSLLWDRDEQRQQAHDVHTMGKHSSKLTEFKTTNNASRLINRFWDDFVPSEGSSQRSNFDIALGVNHIVSACFYEHSSTADNSSRGTCYLCRNPIALTTMVETYEIYKAILRVEKEICQCSVPEGKTDENWVINKKIPQPIP